MIRNMFRSHYGLSYGITLVTVVLILVGAAMFTASAAGVRGDAMPLVTAGAASLGALITFAIVIAMSKPKR